MTRMNFCLKDKELLHAFETDSVAETIANVYGPVKLVTSWRRGEEI